MSKWKELKSSIRKNFNQAIPVYELDYSHVFVKIDHYTVYDLQDKQYYNPQTGIF